MIHVIIIGVLLILGQLASAGVRYGLRTGRTALAGWCLATSLVLGALAVAAAIDATHAAINGRSA